MIDIFSTLGFGPCLWAWGIESLMWPCLCQQHTFTQNFTHSSLPPLHNCGLKKMPICSKCVLLGNDDGNSVWDIAKIFTISVIIKHTVEKYSTFKKIKYIFVSDWVKVHKWLEIRRWRNRIVPMMWLLLLEMWPLHTDIIHTSSVWNGWRQLLLSTWKWFLEGRLST